jgi:hypothetical protein
MFPHRLSQSLPRERWRIDSLDYRGPPPIIGIFRISIIEAQVGMNAITDCMLTEMARQTILARACCRQDSPSARKDSSSERTLSAAEKSQTETPAIVMLVGLDLIRQQGTLRMSDASVDRIRALFAGG